MQTGKDTVKKTSDHPSYLHLPLVECWLWCHPHVTGSTPSTFTSYMVVVHTFRGRQTVYVTVSNSPATTNFGSNECKWYLSSTITCHSLFWRFRMNQFFTPLLHFSLWGNCSGFPRGKLIVTFWLAEAAGWLGSPEPSIMSPYMDASQVRAHCKTKSSLLPIGPLVLEASQEYS